MGGWSAGLSREEMDEILAENLALANRGIADSPQFDRPQALATWPGLLARAAQLGSITRRTPFHTSESRRHDSRPATESTSALSTVASWVTLTIEGRGSPPSPFGSRTFPGKPPYLRLEVIAATTTVLSRVRLKRSCCSTIAGRHPAGAERRGGAKRTQMMSPCWITIPRRDGERCVETASQFRPARA